MDPSSDSSTDVLRAVVIGAGVIGSAIGLELARRGHRVTIVDRGPAPGHGSTAASSAVVRFTYSTVAGTAMAYEGVSYWTRWADHIGLHDGRPLTRFVQCGMVFLDDPSGLARGSLPPLDEVGVRYEWWDRDELQRRLPDLSTDSWFPPTTLADDAFFAAPRGVLGGALFTPEAGYVTDPQLAAQNLADAAVAAGAELRCGAEVVAIHRAPGGSRAAVTGVELAGGATLACDVVVNAAGPHSSRVNALAGVSDMNVGLRPLRQQVEHVQLPAHLVGRLDGFPTCADFDSGMYLRPDTGALLVGGVEAECDPLVWLDDPDDVDLALDPVEWETKVMRLARRIPALGVPHDRRGVVGVYDVSDDWLPVLDRSDIDGFYLAVGTSGNQFKNAAIIGFCMAELVDAVEAGHPHDADPLVVTGPHRGLAIDLGTFSRHRTISGAGSRGVLG